MRLLVSGGGTGGHIYPALALIERLKQVEPDTEVLYVGTTRGLENKIVPDAGIKLETMHMQGFKRSLSLDNVKTIYLFLHSVHHAKKIIRDFKPDVVLGTGATSVGRSCMRRLSTTSRRSFTNKTVWWGLPTSSSAVTLTRLRSPLRRPAISSRLTR